MANNNSVLATLIDKHRAALANAWLAAQKRDGRRETGTDAATTELAQQFLDQLHRGVTTGRSDDITGAEWRPMRELLEDFSRSRAIQGFSPSETAIFVFSLKEPLFEMLRREPGTDAEQIGRETWTVTRLLDALGLYTIEVLRPDAAKRSSAGSSRNCSSCPRPWWSFGTASSRCR